MMKTDELIHYEKKVLCNYVILCNNLVLFKIILRVRQLLFKIIQRNLRNGPESQKYVLTV